jgi:hypothetical protein
MAVPFSTWLFGGVGALFVVRGLWNPHRALTHSGAVASCPGPDNGGCQDTLAIEAEPGTPIYSVGSGTVIAVGDRWLHIQVANEPVVLHYSGLTPSVAVGQTVGRGRRIGDARQDGPVEFGVTGMINENGSAALASLEPRSWLAARGFNLTVKRTPESALWCGPGRHVAVPQPVHMGCGLRMPEKSNFALLPVSITEQ